MQEGVVALVERLGDPVRDDAGADRGVARGHALRAGDHVRHVAELVAGEDRAEAAEGADDLVGDEQHVVLVADLADPLEVAGRRREAAARVLHGLQEDGRDGLGALEEDLLLDLVGGPAAERLRVVAEERGAVDVGVRHLVRAGDQRLEGGLQRRETGDGQGALRGAVVGDRTRDDLVLGRLALELEVLLGQLPRGLDGLAATGGEEDLVQVARGVVGEPLGQLDGLRWA